MFSKAHKNTKLDPITHTYSHPNKTAPIVSSSEYVQLPLLDAAQTSQYFWSQPVKRVNVTIYELDKAVGNAEEDALPAALVGGRKNYWATVTDRTQSITPGMR